MKHLKLFEQDDWWDEESPFDELDDNSELKIGDYVVIMNNDMGGQLKIGSIHKIEKDIGNGYTIRGLDNDKFLWWYRYGDVRKATKKEIEKLLNPFNKIKRRLFEQVDEEDDWWYEESPFDKLEDDFKAGDVVVILNNKHSGGFRVGTLGVIIEKLKSGYTIRKFGEHHILWYKGDGEFRKATQSELLKGRGIL